MNKINQILTVGAVVLGLGLGVSPVLADDDMGENCVPVSVKMAVGPGSCEVLDYTVGDVGFQEAFYPWTSIDGSLFNCEAIGDWMTIVQPVLWPDGLVMPTSLAGDIIEGTLGDEEVVGSIACAGHQNTFKQAFLSPMFNLPFIRTQNISVASLEVPIRGNNAITAHVAFSGTGILHIEDPETYHIGASTAGTVVGLVIETKNKVFVRNKADGHLQVQGHIFEPEDPDPGMLTGYICDGKLAKLVGWEADDDDDDDEEEEDD